MKRKFPAVFSLLFVMSLLLAACGGSGETDGAAENQGEGDSQEEASGESHSFRLSLNVPPTHAWTESAEVFKEELEKQSDGRLTVELFPNSQLGGTKDITQMLNQGTLDFAYIPTAFLTGNYEELNAWYMPFLFDSVEEAMEMADTEASEELLGLFEEQGFVGVDWAFTSNHHILMKSGAVTSPDAFEGKKLRAPGTDAIDDLYNELGASSVAMPLSEVYTSLQTGVVDGINASVESVSSAKYHEVANDYTLLNQTAFNSVILMSKKTKNELSEEDQEIVNSAFKEAVNWLNNEIIETRDSDLEELSNMEDFNIHEIEDYTPFHEARDTIYEKYSSEYPLIKQFIEEAPSSGGE